MSGFRKSHVDIKIMGFLDQIKNLEFPPNLYY